MLSSWQGLLLREHLKCKIMQGGWCRCQELLLAFLWATQDPEILSRTSCSSAGSLQARGALGRVGPISSRWQRPPKGATLSSPPVRGVPQVQPTRHNFCGSPRSHFLRAEVFKREGTFTQFLFSKKMSAQPKGSRRRWHWWGRQRWRLGFCLPASQRAIPVPIPVPFPVPPPPSPLQPRSGRRTEAAQKRSSSQPGWGRWCWLVLG